MANDLLASGDNPFSAYGRAASQRSIVGKLIKFTKYGEWVIGQNEEEIHKDEKFIVLMDDLMVGWQKWSGGAPAEQEMGKLSEKYKPPGRKELGDLDESQWERDDRGAPRDPWQRTNWVVLKDSDGDQFYTYSPSSKGGLTAVAMLCDTYGKMMRQNPKATQYPLVSLETSFYRHAQFGKTYTPLLKVVGWVERDDSMTSAAGVQDTSDEEERAPF